MTSVTALMVAALFIFVADPLMRARWRRMVQATGGNRLLTPQKDSDELSDSSLDPSVLKFGYCLQASVLMGFCVMSVLKAEDFFHQSVAGACIVAILVTAARRLYLIEKTEP